MSTTTLQKKSSPGAIMLTKILSKFDARRYLPKLAGGFLKFNADGELVADTDVNMAGLLIGSVDSKSGAGAISVTSLTTKLTTTAADALTLADGVEGQLKRIVMVADGGDGTLTPATKTGFATITFSAVGQSALLQFHATVGWTIVALNGAVAG